MLYKNVEFDKRVKMPLIDTLCMRRLSDNYVSVFYLTSDELVFINYNCGYEK